MIGNNWNRKSSNFHSGLDWKSRETTNERANWQKLSSEPQPAGFLIFSKVNSLPRGLLTRLKILLGHLYIFHQTNSILIVLPSERNILDYFLMFTLISMSVTFCWLSFVLHLLTFSESLEVSLSAPVFSAGLHKGVLLWLKPKFRLVWAGEKIA